MLLIKKKEEREARDGNFNQFNGFLMLNNKFLCLKKLARKKI